MANGKGSRRRPKQITERQLEQNWRRTFRKLRKKSRKK